MHTLTMIFLQPQETQGSIFILSIVPVLQGLAREIIDVFLSDPVVGGVCRKTWKVPFNRL
jgi:hypothetical protein